MTDIIEAHRKLRTALRVGNVLPYDEESPFADDLARGRFSWDGPFTDSAARARIRYVAALFPDLSFQELASTIGSFLQDARDLTDSDVRMILAGRNLHNSARTEEVDIERVQQIGKLLKEGRSKTEIARLAGVSRDTVQSIDWYLGLSEALYQKRMEIACDCVRENLPIRRAAELIGVSKSGAHRFMTRARNVLRDIGEVK
jgi:transposase-like protein